MGLLTPARRDPTCPRCKGLVKRVPRIAGSPYRTIYAGGTQVWQNIDDTLALCEQTADFATFEFLSLDHEKIEAMAATMSFAPRARFAVVGKNELPARYLASDFGFVLRDDTAVNRVSCPTKPI